MIWDAMTLMWRHCNGVMEMLLKAKQNFHRISITNIRLWNSPRVTNIVRPGRHRGWIYWHVRYVACSERNTVMSLIPRVLDLSNHIEPDKNLIKPVFGQLTWWFYDVPFTLVSIHVQRRNNLCLFKSQIEIVPYRIDGLICIKTKPE